MAVRHRIRRAVEECWERFGDQGAESRQTRGTHLLYGAGLSLATSGSRCTRWSWNQSNTVDTRRHMAC